LAVGEPAINPMPRRMIEENIRAVAEKHATPADCLVTVSIDDGAKLAERTWNGRLGIVGGLSVLGTTGIVVPYSCSAWIASIRQGIDVARASGITHVAACTGSTSEAAVKGLYGFGDEAIIDMGDFVGGMAKYLKRNPISKLTLAGGFAKLSKLAAGHLDLHSKRSEVDPQFIADLVGMPSLAKARTALEMLQMAGPSLAEAVARRAAEVVRAEVSDQTEVEVAVFDRSGNLVGRA
jgi:cobalt-precorrin-5B (C1)-methyltransferase